jgi:copper chaperone
MTMETKIEITGMSCGHCVAAVKRALGGVDGVEVREVAIGSATVAYDPATVSRERIAEAIEDEGSEARVA